MMSDETFEQKLNKLPKFVAEFLESPDVADIIIDVKNKNNLEKSQLIEEI